MDARAGRRVLNGLFEDGFQRSVADDEEVGIRSIPSDAGEGIDEIDEAFLRIEPSYRAQRQGLGGDYPRREVRRRNTLEKSGIHAIGDDLKLFLRESGGDREIGHGSTDADVAGDQGISPAIESEIPGGPAFGDSDSADDMPDRGLNGGDPTEEIGVKQERLQEKGLLTPEFIAKPQKACQESLSCEIEAGYGDSRFAQGCGQNAFPGEAIDFSVPTMTIQTGDQAYEGPLRPPGVEFRDAEGDGNGLVHVIRPVGGRKPRFPRGC